MPPTPIKVLYIAGAGRSGTTILDTLLGEIDGFFSAGELRWLWWGGLMNDWQCGCTRPVPQCDVWQTILTTAYGDKGLTRELAANAVRLQQQTIRLHLLPRLMAQRAGEPTGWRNLDDYVELMDRLYRAIAEVTGARVIVDSSKLAPEASVLRLMPSIDPYLVHIVRDPRGHAQSMRRKVKMEPTADKTFEQPRHNPAISALIWMRRNSAADLALMKYPSSRRRLLRYEDLVARPKASIESLAHFVGEAPAGLRFHDDERTVELNGNHTAWGNPSRFKTGTVEIRYDDEWMSKLKRLDRLAPTALSLPLMLRYRYPLRTKS